MLNQPKTTEGPYISCYSSHADTSVLKAISY